jgi:secondary thiamine-phosphate synthase enzyme
MLINHKINTHFNEVYPVHDLIKADIKMTGVKDGLCVIYCPHTTAGLTLTSKMDPLGHEDLQEELTRLVPTRIDFKHQVDTPQDAA